MQWVLGLDGGGTKTDLAAAPLQGGPFPQVRVGGSSLSRSSAAEVSRELAQGLQTLLAPTGLAAEQCSAVCAGFASAGSGGNCRVYKAILADLLPSARVAVLTDAELAWRGATRTEEGIVVIAGTGSIAWGRYRGRTAQAGGGGPGHDPGSGDWIGRRAVEAGLHPPPAGGNFAALMPELVAHPGLAPILDDAGRLLAQLLQHCAEELAWSEPVAFPVGGIFAHFPAVRTALARHWGHPLLSPIASPIAAALALARVPVTSHSAPLC
ncbi:MAG: BadF/BadG/BcrA/BcrD ATPase family protein [Terriglobales bacterium]